MFVYENVENVENVENEEWSKEDLIYKLFEVWEEGEKFLRKRLQKVMNKIELIKDGKWPKV